MFDHQSSSDAEDDNTEEDDCGILLTDNDMRSEKSRLMGKEMHLSV